MDSLIPSRLVPVGASTVLGLGLLVGCAEGPPPTAPAQELGGTAEWTTVAAAGAPAMVKRADVFSFATEEVVEGAVAQLVRTNSGIAYNIRTNGLGAGHAVTVWWVIFNHPEACDGDCGIEDLFVDFPVDLTPNPDVNPAVMSAGGNVVGKNGRAGFSGHLIVGQITNEHPAFVDGPGLLDPRGAEIHMVVRSHGPMIPAEMPAQISTFGGGCVENLPAGTPPEEEGQCSDLQFAVFK